MTDRKFRSHRTAPRLTAVSMSMRLLWTATVAIWIALAPPLRAQRVVAVGDIHGAIDAFESILRAADLIDATGQWSGGEATFVQTGDLTDRGEHVRAVLDRMMALEAQAEAAGGRVVALLGNHEINNLVGYFGPEASPPASFGPIVSHFADDGSEKRRRKAYSSWSAWRRRYPQCAGEGSRKAFLGAHPPGAIEYMEALSPDGRYGAWLRQRQVVAQIDDTIFLHGGLSPDPPEDFPTDTLDAINRQIALEIERFDEDKAWLVEQQIVLPFSYLGEMFCAVRSEAAALSVEQQPGTAARRERLEAIYERLPLPQTWLSFHGEGPIWFRGWARWSDEEGPDRIARVAEAYGARRFVAGHTPHAGEIQSRFDNQVFLIDTGMVFGPAAGARPAALEFVGDRARALYEDSTATFTGPEAEDETAETVEPVAGVTWLDPEGEPLPFSTPEQVADFLRQATIEAVQDIPVGVTKPKRLTLAQGALRARAAFRHIDVSAQRRRLSTGKFVMHFRDNFINEVAAYELSRMLGLNTIPPAIEREIDGQPGSVQIWVENAMMETERRERKIEPPNRLRFTRQFYDMRVFDNLINNTDRNSGNILLDRNWNMWWIDHTRSFARGKELPAPHDVIGCSRSLYQAIRSLDDEQVTERLRPYLGMPEIRALHERRRRLIETIEQRIAEKGEDRVVFSYGDPDNRVRIVYGDERDEGS